MILTSKLQPVAWCANSKSCLKKKWKTNSFDALFWLIPLLLPPLLTDCNQVPSLATQQDGFAGLLVPSSSMEPN